MTDQKSNCCCGDENCPAHGFMRAQINVRGETVQKQCRQIAKLRDALKTEMQHAVRLSGNRLMQIAQPFRESINRIKAVLSETEETDG